MKAFTLKIRGGVEVDSAGKKAGKGALIQEDLSATLGVSQDQTLFQPIPNAVAYGVVSKGNGDAFINPKTHTAVTAGGGQAGQGYPCVMVENHPNDYHVNLDESQDQTLFQPIGVDLYNQCLTGDKTMTITGGRVDNHNIPAVVCMATQQGGAEIMEDLSPTITAAAGMSGNNQPVICIEGHIIDRETEQNGRGWREDQCYTLNTIDRPVQGAVQAVSINGQVAGTLDASYYIERDVVVYGISSYASNAMKSNNPHAGIYEATTSRTLDLNGGNPACNQGGMCVVYPKKTGPLMANSHPGSYSGQDAYQDMFIVEQRTVGALCHTDYKFPQQQQINQGKYVIEKVKNNE